MPTPVQTSEQLLKRQPDLRDRVSFFVRSSGLKAIRFVKDTRNRSAMARRGDISSFPHVMGESISALRTHADPREQVFENGKIQNLRIACERLHLLEFKAGEIFSFWKSLGPAWASRGFVVGREIREGCLIPTVGGGLCQLSGSLYEAATHADFEIVERHKHTRQLPGVEYVASRDATVYWNYVDFRFRARVDFVIEAQVLEEQIVIRFWARNPHASRARELTTDRGATIATDCITCGKTSCATNKKTRGLTDALALLLEPMPEFADHMTEQLVFSARPVGRLKAALAIRNPLLPNYAVSRSLVRARIAAKTFSPQIRRHPGSLLIAQHLLPHLWKLGSLTNRDYEVLLTHLPLGLMQARLDEAHKLYPHSKTLGEFRVDSELIKNEISALANAKGFLTSHAELAKLFPNAQKLTTTLSAHAHKTSSELILFPGPTAEREGARLVRDLAKKTGRGVFVRGPHLEEADFWDGVRIERADTIPWHRIACVVHPTLFEARPSIHRQALAREIAVIGTDGCGLDEHPKNFKIQFGDFAAAEQIFSQIIGANQQ